MQRTTRNFTLMILCAKSLYYNYFINHSKIILKGIQKKSRFNMVSLHIRILAFRGGVLLLKCLIGKE